MIKLKEIFLEVLQEMPHVELDSGEVIDLQIEKYTISSIEKSALQKAFRLGQGVFAKSRNGNLVFSRDGMRTAKPGDEALPNLPEDWERYAVQA